MGTTAENIATKFGFTREEQDEFAASSQQKAEAALNDNVFADEIIPIEIPERRGDPIVFD
jgi:acetyl-CoA C-acetyltransferase